MPNQTGNRDHQDQGRQNQKNDDTRQQQQAQNDKQGQQGGQHRGGQGNFANDRERAAEAGRKGGQS